MFNKYKKAYNDASTLAYLNKVEAVKYREVIQTVRQFHQPDQEIITVGGATVACGTCYREYPCPAIKALNGEQI